MREERERVIALLCDSFASDALPPEEFERRVDRAHRAVSIAELGALVKDLSVPEKAVVVATPRAAAPIATPELPRREQQTIVAVLGATVRAGSWRPARRVRALSLLGGMSLDFRDVRLLPGVTTLRVAAVLGGVEIIVPPGLAVATDGLAVMGGFSQVDRAPDRPDPEAPLLHVSGIALLGGVSVELRLPGESERDARRRRKRERRELRRPHER
jgi:hypothetical protein